MPQDVVTFIDAIRRAHLLEAGQLDEVARQLQPRLPESRALAGELIKRNWLTPYQANQLLQGRGRELLLGSYVLLERLGEGGIGQVFKARNWKLGTVVALKLIRKERLDNPDAVRRFHREIRAAAQLDHPNIVRAIDADEVDGTHLLVMEYMPGVDLAKLVKQQGRLPVDKACDYCRQAALGLQHASERGLVHRDVKPHNLLLTPSGVVKILDMGLARLDRARQEDEASSTMTQEGTVMGTLDFIAPEQAMDSHAVDSRADLYSLGCTLYFLLTGRVPFPGGTAMEKLVKHQSKEPEPVERVRPDVPAAVAALVRKLMAKRPEERCQTAAEAATALAAAGQDKTSSAMRVVEQATTVMSPGWSSLDTPTGTQNTAAAPRRKAAWRPSRWVLIGGGLSVALLALGLTVLLMTLARPASPPAAAAAWAAKGTGPQEQTETAKAAFEKWRQEVAALPAEKQGDAVGAELKRRNPDFDGTVKATVENGVVTGLEFLTDNVTDLSPVRALPRLESLECRGSSPGKGRLADLSPLNGATLTWLNCGSTRVSDLSPLKEVPLTGLDIGDTQASDLSPLKGMRLTTLQCYGTPVSDLSPLMGMPLTELGFALTRVSDLAPLKGMPLTRLHCAATPVSDLSALRGAKLTWLDCGATQVTDLSPLEGMPLVKLRCDFDPKRDAVILRSIKTLETINDKPAAEFWKDVDARPPDPKP